MHSVMAPLSLLVLLASTVTVQASNVWTVNCAPLTVQRTDPMVSPGGVAGHVHAVSGGTLFSASMPDINSAVNAAATTCDKFTDHSNYWCPQLYQQVPGGFKIIPFTGVNSYYENFTCDYHPSGKCDTPRNAHAFPPGFRMIAGDSERRTQNNSDETNQAVLYTSGNQKNVYGFPTVLGTNFQAAMRFPSCWDGVNVDSADHKSHVAYPDPALGGDTTGGMCPQSHPVALISIGSEFGFQLPSPLPDPKTLIWSNGDTTGYGFHADFIQGWKDLPALQASFSNCFDNNNCPWRAFDAPNGVAPNPTPRVPQVQGLQKAVTEDIGLTGNVIAALPGNNPVYTPGSGTGTSTQAVSSSVSQPTTLATKVATKTSSVSFVAATCPPGCVPVGQAVLN